ncbi:hypothetical protein BH18ACI4_BH18ACI4_00650 [soil metagenome]
MADNEMTEHVSTSKMERFCARALEDAELTTVARHIANCSDCGPQFVTTLGRQEGTTSLSFTLAPEFWIRHEHIDYERLVELSDKKLDSTDRELIDLHLKVCPTCREDVAGFLAFREQIAPELQVSYPPVGLEPARKTFSGANSWRGLAWKPIYVAAVVVIGIALVIGSALFLKRRADNFQAKQTPIPKDNIGTSSQTPTPENRAANSPSPPAMPNETPVENPNSSAPIIALNDRAAIVTVDKNGRVFGLDDVPPRVRYEIARALLSEGIERPSILRDLAGENSALRGNNTEQLFKLISPTRAVLVSDQPRFKWEGVSRASTYRVYVNDSSGHEVARSEELSPQRTEWSVSKPLKRGEIYAWTVVAVVDGKEIVSPGPSSPEMKFQVLSTSSLQQLNKLKKTRSHLALGVFYAQKGMNAEAEREFQILVRDNPRSQHANKLLRQIQSWQRP